MFLVVCPILSLNFSNLETNARLLVVRTFSDRGDYNISLQVIDPATPLRRQCPWLTFGRRRPHTPGFASFLL